MLEHDRARHYVPARKHNSPTFLQPYLALHPFSQLQKNVFSSFSGAGGSKVWS